jgi:hypothetical protein
MSHIMFAAILKPQHDPLRRGLATIELLVAMTLLISVISFATTMTIRNGRLLTATRHYRLGLDELSNQIERLAALPANELPLAIERLTPSPFATKYLANAELKAELQPTEVGQRLTLELSWKRSQPDTPPITLTAWIAPTKIPNVDRQEPGS